MTPLKFYRVQSLPEQGEIGSLYFVYSGVSPKLYVYTTEGFEQYSDLFNRDFSTLSVDAIANAGDGVVYFTPDTHQIIKDGIKYGTDLTGYATESWVEGKGYLTEHQDISGKVDVSDFEEATKVTSAALNLFHSNTLWQTEDTYVKCDKSKTLEEALSGESDTVYFTTDSHQIVMGGQAYSDIPLYQQYKLYGGTVSEQAFSVIMKYHLTPFMISNTGTTVIPDDLLNNTQTNFITEYYWNLIRLTGGEPVITTQWSGNIPSKLKGISSGKEFNINFANKTISLIS